MSVVCPLLRLDVGEDTDGTDLVEKREEVSNRRSTSGT